MQISNSKTLLPNDIASMISTYCCVDDLSTFDPYDIWKTTYGFQIKSLFNKNRKLGLIPAALLTIYDLYLNKIRFGYSKQEYSIVRAQSALTLLNLYEADPLEKYLIYAEKHVEWLIENACETNASMGWGLGFSWAVDKDMVYNEKTPTATMTPYVLEAIVKLAGIKQNRSYDKYINKILTFFMDDIKILYEDDSVMATSYAPYRDRIVINSCSYTMYSLAVCRQYVDAELRKKIDSRIVKLFNFICTNQNADGSFLYSPEGVSFIDCFHSCFVIKNIIKTQKICSLIDASKVIDKSYSFVTNEFEDTNGLYRRFAITNKPSLIKYDLYDNAEVIHLMLLKGDVDKAANLINIVLSKFTEDSAVYSQIDIFGIKSGAGTLRWAVMPFMYSLSSYILALSEK